MDIPGLLYFFSAIAVGCAVTVGVGVLALTPADFKLARASFWLAALLTGAIAMTWGVTTDQPLLIRLVVTGVLGAVAVAGLTEALRWVAKKESQVAAPRPEVLSAQHQELQRVSDFFGGKDEHALMQAFDFEGFVKFNLIRAKQILAPDKVTPTEGAAMEAFFGGGQAIMDARYVRITPYNGGQKVDLIPGRVGILRTSKKYEEAKRALLPFETSPHMPATVQEAIKDFDATVAANAALIIEVVNQKIAEDVNHLHFADAPGSPHNGVIFNAYWNRFTPLKPKADAILAHIRAHLGVK